MSIGRDFSHGMAFEEARQKRYVEVQDDSASESARFRKLRTGRSELMLWPVRHLTTSTEVEKYLQLTLIPGFKAPELNPRHFDVSTRPIFYDTLHFAVAKGKYSRELKHLQTAIKQGRKNAQLDKLLANFN